MSELETAELQARMRQLVAEHRQARAPTPDADARVWSRVQHSMLSAPFAASTVAAAGEAGATAPQAVAGTGAGVASKAAGVSVTAAAGLGKGAWVSLAWSLVGAGGVTTAVVVAAQLQGQPDVASPPQVSELSNVSVPAAAKDGQPNRVPPGSQVAGRRVVPAAFHDVDEPVLPSRPAVRVEGQEGLYPDAPSESMQAEPMQAEPMQDPVVAGREPPSEHRPSAVVSDAPRRVVLQARLSRKPKNTARPRPNFKNSLNDSKSRRRPGAGDSKAELDRGVASMPRQLHDLAEVDRAVRGGASGRALRLVEKFERAYPGSALQQELDALKLLAECQAQSSPGSSLSRARVRAERWLKRWPGSKFAARLRVTCGIEGRR